jgi:transposase
MRPSSPRARARVEGRPLRRNERRSSEARTVPSRSEPATRNVSSQLRADYEVVKAGLRLPWSTGPVEGQINRLKMLKCSMFGRAKMDLLSRRFLLTA